MHTDLELDKAGIPIQCVRLRLYDTLKNLATTPLDPASTTDTLKTAQLSRTHPLALEIRAPDAEFQPWTEGDLALSVKVFRSKY